eukprot:GHVU01216503.1.p1 GENE.GHVU01216503.1~~GHVU01216503.1.p1  ORF type:complete len:101 (-),score=11.25 GHVU01216503.1:145-447(-)
MYSISSSSFSLLFSSFFFSFFVFFFFFSFFFSFFSFSYGFESFTLFFYITLFSSRLAIWSCCLLAVVAQRQRERGSKLGMGGAPRIDSAASCLLCSRMND